MEVLIALAYQYPVLSLFLLFLIVTGTGNGVYKLFNRYLDHNLEMKKLEVKREKLMLLRNTPAIVSAKTDDSELTKEDKELIRLDTMIKKLENI